MAYTLEEIEYLHDMGLMEDWVYYQQNGKSAQENYNKQMRIQQLEYYKEMYSNLYEQKLEKELEYKLGNILDNTLDKLLKDFK